MKVILLTIVLIGIAFLGMAFNIVIRKKRFPETHVGHNKEMRKRGIVCAKTMDKLEQKKAREQFRYKKLTLVEK